MLKEFIYGSMYESGFFTNDFVLEKIKEDFKLGRDSSFYIQGKKTVVHTCDELKSFYITKYEGDNSTFSVMYDTYRLVGSVERLADLISEYDDDKLLLFEKSVDYSLRNFISELSIEEKDNILYTLLNKNMK